MKMSFTTMATPEMDIREEAALARRFGYDGIDLRVSDNMGKLQLKSTHNEIVEVKNILQSEDILLAGLFCYNRCADSDEKSWTEMKDSLLRHLELAAKVGSPSIRIFGGDPLKYHDREEYIQRMAELLSDVLYQDGSGVAIILQNHINGFSALQTLSMAEMVGNSRFGMAYSPDHCLLMKEDMEQAGALVRKHVRQLYVADLIPKDGGYICVLPGYGVVPFKDAHDLIGGQVFCGWITLKWEKIWHPDLESAEIALPHFRKYWVAGFTT